MVMNFLQTHVETYLMEFASDPFFYLSCFFFYNFGLLYSYLLLEQDTFQLEKETLIEEGKQCEVHTGTKRPEHTNGFRLFTITIYSANHWCGMARKKKQTPHNHGYQVLCLGLNASIEDIHGNVEKCFDPRSKVSY